MFEHLSYDNKLNNTLKNQVGDFCFESIHEDKMKAKI